MKRLCAGAFRRRTDASETLQHEEPDGLQHECADVTMRTFKDKSFHNISFWHSTCGKNLVMLRSKSFQILLHMFLVTWNEVNLREKICILQLSLCISPGTKKERKEHVEKTKRKGNHAGVITGSSSLLKQTTRFCVLQETGCKPNSKALLRIKF